MKRVKEGVLQLLENRKFEIESIEETDSETDVLAKKREGKKDLKFLVRIPNKSVVGIALVRTLDKAVKKLGVDQALLATLERYTPAAKAEAKKKNIELLPTKYPIFNIFEHVLVPKHELLSEEEAKEVLQQYNITKFQLPAIRASDPAAKAIGAKPGHIVKIYRESPTAGLHIVYRVVID
ncbi:MAG: DNA-directed RNA polymerase subunit H [Promethearchaeota archaeon]